MSFPSKFGVQMFRKKGNVGEVDSRMTMTEKELGEKNQKINEQYFSRGDTTEIPIFN